LVAVFVQQSTFAVGGYRSDKLDAGPAATQSRGALMKKLMGDSL